MQVFRVDFTQDKLVSLVEDVKPLERQKKESFELKLQAQGISQEQESSDEIRVIVNGRLQTVRDLNPSARLASYLRDGCNLKGIQTACGQSACGACTVLMSYTDHETGEIVHSTIHSCSTLLGSMDGRQITTIEAIGGKTKGYHPIQQRLSASHGTQCGYCTPGFVTQMFGILLNDREPDSKTIEDGFDGNLCRCTGYRAILSAMQSFAKPCDSESPETTKLRDLGSVDVKMSEDLVSPDLVKLKSRPISTKKGWRKPTNLEQVFGILEDIPPDVPKRLCVGNTASGVSKWYPPVHQNDRPNVFIDISAVPELLQVTNTDAHITFGASVTLKNMVEALKADKDQNFLELANHICKIGSSQLRNIACWAGNLVLTQTHPEFPSDLATVLVVFNCAISVRSKHKTKSLTIIEFLATPLDPREIVTQIAIPKLKENITFSCFKVAARRQNKQAYVNAGFRVELDDENLVKEAKLYYGGVTKGVWSPPKTVNVLKGRPLISQTLETALQSLTDELKEAPELSEVQCQISSSEYRQKLAVNLFYKFFLGLQEHLEPQFHSATTLMERDISVGTQTYDEPDEKLSPMTYPIPKIEGLPQTAGELSYTGDMYYPKDGLYAAPILTTQARGTILEIDPSPALGIQDVVSFIGASDLSGIGATNDMGVFPGEQPVFLDVGMDVQYHGQGAGLIIAKSKHTARFAAKRVIIKYGDTEKKSASSIKEAMDLNLYPETNYFLKPNTIPFPGAWKRGDVEQGLSEAEFTLSGEITVKPQEHFYMEPFAFTVFPEDNKIRIISTCQGASVVRDKVSTLLNIPSKDVIVVQPRLGGAFGGKQIDAGWFAAEVAVAAKVMGVPVRMVFNREEDMLRSGKRSELLTKYKVGFNEGGKIVALDLFYVMDAGASVESTVLWLTICCFSGDNAYNIPHYRADGTIVTCNRITGTAMRNPGQAEAIYVTEQIVEAVSQHLKMDPADVRALNFYKNGDMSTACDSPPDMDFFKFNEMSDMNLQPIWDRIKEDVHYENLKSEIDSFNGENMWRKRGVNLLPLRYHSSQSFHNHNCSISISSHDGTVTVCHSGAEMGQGMNTKISQAVSHKLGIPMESIDFENGSTALNSSAGVTSATTTSEVIVKAANEACDILNERLRPFKENHPDLSFPELIVKAHQGGMDLNASGHCGFPRVSYFTYATACHVVELDILTGEYEILSCDVCFDVGKSMNPLNDIGQLEGGYLQGLGLYTSESIIYDSEGHMINPSPWDYTLPTSQSIPIKWNVSFMTGGNYDPGVYGSKGFQEAVMLLSMGANFAIQSAIRAARQQEGIDDILTLDTPLTPEKAQLACKVSTQGLTLGPK